MGEKPCAERRVECFSYTVSSLLLHRAFGALLLQSANGHSRLTMETMWVELEKNGSLGCLYPRSAARASTHSSHPASGLSAILPFFLMPRSSLLHTFHLSRSQFGFQKESGGENKNREKELGESFTLPRRKTEAI